MNIPRATYRFQFNKDFPLARAAELAGYLSLMGFSDVYASPVFKAAEGSTHGYDVTDPGKISCEIGGITGFEKAVKACAAQGVSWVQDIVPNHMAFTKDNYMLMDVLESGIDSKYKNFFDVTWGHSFESMHGRLLAPFLGEPYGEALESGKIKVQYSKDGLTAGYYEHSFPIAIKSYYSFFTGGIDELKKKLGRKNNDYMRFTGALYVLKNLKGIDDVTERKEQIDFVKSILWELYESGGEIKTYIDGIVTLYNGEPGKPESFNLLDALLKEQYFRLALWKVASEEINYRRFFNINGLISVKVEEPEVFNAIHRLVLELISKGLISGLRIDHIDGLYDPTAYIRILKKAAPEAYIVVEKILESTEKLPAYWTVQGTTGYDFMNYVNGIFVMQKNEKEMTKAYEKFTGAQFDYYGVMTAKKRLIIGKRMAGDVDNLASAIKDIMSKYRHGSDITMYGIKRALVEVLAFFPVYRAYVNNEYVTDKDTAYIKETIEAAKRNAPGLSYELDFMKKFLLLEFDDFMDEPAKQGWIKVVMKLQQLTGPLMAKGFEDTFLYIYNRLLSLNEVGSSPDKFGISIREFNNFCLERARLWPHTMNATSTHDAKRGEDSRARLNVLSEMPKAWSERTKKWASVNYAVRPAVISKNDEYMVYQALLSAWPFNEAEVPGFRERVKDFVIKAVREAKVYTAWIKPDEIYENAVTDFAMKITDPVTGKDFLHDFLPFVKKVSFYGVLNSLSQACIKIAAPGVPDFYRGTELWEFAFVDPDNRRALDYGVIQNNAAIIKERENDPSFTAEILAKYKSGLVKQFLIFKMLNARRKEEQLFTNGGFVSLKTAGRHADKVITFARDKDKKLAVIAAPRFTSMMVREDEMPAGEHVWGDTHIILPEDPPQVFTCAITGKTVKADGRKLYLRDVLAVFPCGLVISE